jgi:FkbM family methyltransferase
MDPMVATPRQRERMEVDSNLVFDIGFHVGEDTEYYLKRGFNVVAVEANPSLHAAGCERFAAEVATGQLVLLNKAIGRQGGEITFHISELSFFSTADEAFAERSRELGHPTHPITVEAVTIADLINAYGVPYYLKVDIEGFDMVAIEGLLETEGRPAYLSLESDKVSIRGLRREYEVLTRLGYDRFKRVNQWRVERQRPAALSDWQFHEGCSGNFGEDAPGQWRNAESSFESYWLTWIDYQILGDYRLAPRWLRAIWRRLRVYPGWFDTHAKHSSVA